MARKMKTRMKITVEPIDLRAMFSENGLDSNRKVAEALGVSAFTVNQFYQGKTISPATVVKIAHVLGVKPSSIATEVAE